MAGPSNGMPWWVRAINTLGVQTAIIFFLLALLAGLIPSPLTTTDKALAQLVLSLQMHVQLSDQALQSLDRMFHAYTEKHLKILGSLCRNQAKSEAAALECDR